MCDKDTCNDASCCGECEPWNCLEQQINDALATKEEQLQGYVDEAKDAAAESKASAEASAQSAAESKEFRDEAETAASTAVAAEGVVLGVANTLQDTADKLEQIADELGTAIAGVAVSSWFYTTVSENQTVIPVPTDKNAVDVQSIYIEGARQSPFRGFEFDKTAMTITLAEPLPLGLEIEIILGTYNSDNPNDFAHTIASNNGASLVGTTAGITVQGELDNHGQTLNTLNQDVGVLKADVETMLSAAAPLFADHIKTLDYWAARMHGGETVIITGYGDSTSDGNGSSGWTANPTIPVTGFPWPTAPLANSDHNAEAPNAWLAKLQTILRQYHRNNNISVYNAGYSGQQMQNGWANYYFEKAVLQNPYIPSNPDIVIIGFGLNDITDAGNKITEHIAQTIEVMKKVIAAGATPVLMTCDANWRSYNGWNSGTSGRDNEEAAAQIDAAKKYMAEVLGVSIIDQDFMQKTWMSKNSDYSNQYQLQPDGLHWGDTGHAMKAAFVAQSFMPDILRCYGTDIERICWMDSRMRYSKDYTSSWVPDTGFEGYKYSRFPRIWYVQAADYVPNEVIFDFFVWSEGNQDSLIYRNFGNSNIGSAYAADQLPRVKVFSLGNSSAYYDKELPDTGEDEAYINATDRPFYLTKLRYGLNRIQVIAPATSALGAFWGGWFEFNPFWKAKATFGYVNNYGAPNYVQVNALEKTGPLNFRFEADATNNRVAFMNPEMFDGTNCADIGQVGDKIEILVEGFFDTDTGFLFFGGKSLNRNSGSTDNNQEDNCLLLYATSKTFNLLQLRYPYQGSAPYPQIQTGIDDVYSATDRTRKFLIRCEKTSPTTQTIKVYDGWETIDTPVLNYMGDWTQGKFCGGGIIGGVYATRNIARTVRITQLLIRKFK